jgi:hypothetical protein
VAEQREHKSGERSKGSDPGDARPIHHVGHRAEPADE